VRLYDIRGRLVLERTVQAGAWLAYRLGGLAPGNYLLRVEVPGTGERTVQLQVRP
jgi:hypothetical protein